MSTVNHIAQPVPRTTLQAIGTILQTPGFESIDVAAAYITTLGAGDVIGGMRAGLGANWNGITKRWITSFDYCRTEPVALKTLMSVPSSSVRIYDAEFCLSRHGMPRVPFHPKAFLFRTNQIDYALTGSGNLSRSGLSRGVEAGLALGVNRLGNEEPTSVASIQALRGWFLATWNDATPLDAPLLKRYSDLFDSTDNLQNPAPTEDDIPADVVGGGALSSKDLQKLRVCRHFWIEAGNITKNRGPNLPGNQLMMKRLSRVFFGFSPNALPENTPIGTVEIYLGNGEPDPYSLTYSDNKMDKLVLPIPGNNGAPPAYDNHYLLFQKMGPHLFELSLGSPKNKTSWLNKSKAINGAFKMASGREWGVF